MDGSRVRLSPWLLQKVAINASGSVQRTGGDSDLLSTWVTTFPLLGTYPLEIIEAMLQRITLNMHFSILSTIENTAQCPRRRKELCRYGAYAHVRECICKHKNNVLEEYCLTKVKLTLERSLHKSLIHKSRSFPTLSIPCILHNFP